METRSTEIADQYWAEELGCERGQLRPPSPCVQAHGGRLSDYSGAYVIVLDAAALISVPRALAAAVCERAARFSGETLRDFDAMARLLLPGTATMLIGPALLSYADESCFVPTDTVGTRELTARDETAFSDCRAACPPDEWEPKGFSLEDGPIFGTFAPDGTLAAVANIRNWVDRIGHISVVTRPDYRGQGLGPRAVSAATRRALEMGLLPQYRVLESNAASRRVASKLGFQSYGFTVAVRLATGRGA